MSLIKGTMREQGERLLERFRLKRQEAQDLRVDAISAGAQEIEWAMEAVIKQYDSQIKAIEDRLSGKIKTKWNQ